MSTPRDKLINNLQDQTVTYNGTTYTMNLNNSDNSLICSGTFVDESPSPENPSPITCTIPAGNYKIKDSKSGGYWYFTLSEDLYGLSDTVKDSITLSSYYGKGYIDRNCKKVKLNNNIETDQYLSSIGKKYPCIYSNVPLLISRHADTPIKCSHIKNNMKSDIVNGNAIGIWAHNETQHASYAYMTIPYEIIGTTRNSTAAQNVNAFKSWLQAQDTAGTPFEILYQLATPVRTPIVLSKTVISGAIDLPNSSAVTVDPNPYLPIPVMSLGEKDNKVKICVHGQNLFDPKNRIITTHSMMPGFKPSTTPSSIDAFMPDLATPRYYLGYAVSGSFRSYTINKYYIDEKNSKIIFNSKSSGYGIGFNIKVKPNTNYTLYSDTLLTQLRVTYYNKDGMMIGNKLVTGKILNITSPNNCYYIIFLIASCDPNLNITVSAEDIMLLEGTYTESTIPPFIPYKGYTTEITLPKPLYKLSDSIYDTIDFKTSEILNRIKAYKLTSSRPWPNYNNSSANVINDYVAIIDDMFERNASFSLLSDGLMSNYFPNGGYIGRYKLTSIGYSENRTLYLRFDSPETNYGVSDGNSLKTFLANCDAAGIPVYAYFLMDSYTRTKIDLPELRYINDENMVVDIYDNNGNDATVQTLSYYTKTTIIPLTCNSTTFNAVLSGTGLNFYWIYNGTKYTTATLSLTDALVGDVVKLVITGAIPSDIALIINSISQDLSSYTT